MVEISRFWNLEIQELKENLENQNTEKSTSTWLNVWTSLAENKNFKTNLLAYKAKQLDENKQMALMRTDCSTGCDQIPSEYLNLHINNVTSSYFGVLAVLRKIKNMTPQETKKSLVQSLVLSKLNFNDTVTYPLPMFLQKRMQRVQNAAAGFVLNRYCSEEDVLQLGWLPTLENTKLNILKLGHRALYNNWPEYLTLSRST